MRLSIATALFCAVLPGGSTVMPVWHAAAGPATQPPAAHGVAEAGVRERVPARNLRRLSLAGPFPAVVTQVVDGDTFEARVTIWLGHEVTTRVRLLGIDAPEMHSECGQEREFALASRQALAAMLGEGVELSDVRFDKYGGRVLARAGSASHHDISSAMLASGYAIAYEGGRRQAWCDPVVTSRR